MLPGGERPPHQARPKLEKQFYRTQLGEPQCSQCLFFRGGGSLEVFREDTLTQMPPQDLLLKTSLLLREKGPLAGLLAGWD